MVGSTNLDSGGTTYDVVKYIVHDKFENPVQAGHDIALIRIQGPIQFNSYVQPIKYSTVEVPPGTEVLATGWGFNSVNMKYVQLKKKNCEGKKPSSFKVNRKIFLKCKFRRQKQWGLVIYKQSN